LKYAYNDNTIATKTAGTVNIYGKPSHKTREFSGMPVTMNNS
jgi:hypothetical protein